MHATDPTANVYVPAAQLMHVVAPDVEYLPAGQDSQDNGLYRTECGSENFPAAQELHDVDPAVEANLPAAQELHDVDPETDEYMPARQEEHDVEPEEDENFAASHRKHDVCREYG